MVRHVLIGFVFAICATRGQAQADDRSPPAPASKQAAAQSATLAGTGYRINFGETRDWIDDVAARAQLLKAIATWLSVTFDLPLIQSVPSLRLESGPRITALRDTGLLSDRPENRTGSARVQREIVAVYDPAHDTIYLREGWTGNTPAELSILVHEMVHYIQDVANFKFPCLQASEELAYDAQDRWLGQFGTDLATEFGIDRFTQFVRTRCF
jgi:hypothetical protein